MKAFTVAVLLVVAFYAVVGTGVAKSGTAALAKHNALVSLYR